MGTATAVPEAAGAGEDNRAAQHQCHNDRNAGLDRSLLEREISVEGHRLPQTEAWAHSEPPMVERPKGEWNGR